MDIILIYLNIHTHAHTYVCTKVRDCFNAVSRGDVLQWRFFLRVPGAGLCWRSSRRRLLLALPPPLMPSTHHPSPTPTSLWKSESVCRFSSASCSLSRVCVCVLTYVCVTKRLSQTFAALKRAKEIC